MTLRKKKGLSAVTIMALVLGVMASTPAEARNKTKWFKCCDALGNVYKVKEGTPGAVAKPGDAGAPANAVARNKTGWIIISVAALAAVGGILAVTGGNNSPASP